MTVTLPTLEVLFAPSVVGSGYGTRMVLDVSVLDTGTLGDGALFYDITNYARNIDTSRGRRRALDRFNTGSCSITLDNRDRRFDPSNTAGPYYNSTVGVSGVVPGVPIIVRATWNGTLYPIFRGFIDSWSFDYGPGGVGDATATINCSDAFKALSSVIGGLPSSTSVTSSGTTTADIGISSGSSSGSYGISSIDIVGTTTTGNNDVVSGAETTPTIGAVDDLPSTRIKTILDAVAWPDNLRSIDTGSTKLNPQKATQSTLELLQEVAAAEFGAVYVEDDGSIVFQDRAALISEPKSITPQATYDTTTVGGKYFSDVTIAYDDQLIHNIIRINRKNTTAASGDFLLGSTVTIGNPESQSLYGARTLDLELPIPSTSGGDSNYGQTVATDLARFLASVYANPELRPSSLSFMPQADPTQLYPEVLGRRIYDRVTVKFAVPGGGAAISRDCFIEQVNHSITPGEWKTTFGLASATYYTGFFILDNATLGVLDTNKLAF